MIQAVDVHAGYGRIAWEVASRVVRACWAKCTTGNDPGIDAQFVANVAGCRAAGVPVGSYHYAYCIPDHPDHPGRSPEEQAEKAFAGCTGLGSQVGDLTHAVDAEFPAPENAADWGCTRPQISEWLRRYCVRATELWGRKPVIYTYPSWWRWLSSGADVSWASEYLLWFADYSHNGDGVPGDGSDPPHHWWVESTWSDWAVWQYSADGSRARIPGINACPIDRDCIRSETMLLKLMGHDVTPTLPAQPIVHPLPDDEQDESEVGNG